METIISWIITVPKGTILLIAYLLYTRDNIASTACVRTQAQNYHEQLSADRDEFSQGSIPNPLFFFLTLPLEILDLLSMI